MKVANGWAVGEGLAEIDQPCFHNDGCPVGFLIGRVARKDVSS
jgi:hypothetical protein